MRLLSYRLTVPVTVGTMDSYFNIMFKGALGWIDSRGMIVGEASQKLNLNKLKNILEKLSKEHPVRWDLRIYNRGNNYGVTANNGKVEIKRERPINDAGS